MDISYRRGDRHSGLFTLTSFLEFALYESLLDPVQCLGRQYVSTLMIHGHNLP